MSGLLQQAWTRAGAATAVSLLVAGGIAVYGAGEGHPAQDVRLLSGMAWLSSAKVGQLTLLDGSSAEVAAQVQAAPAGNAVEVVQSGSSAYAVDRTAGTIRRVDGATFDMSQPQAPLPGAGAGLTAFAGRDVLYALDSQRGVLMDTDPRTVQPRGEPQSLAAQLGDGTAAMDDAGRLWLVDNATGALTRVENGRRIEVRGVTEPGGNIVTIANGAPAVVNSAGRKVIIVDPRTGAADRTVELDLRSDDSVQVSGSPHSSRVYVVASRGVVNVCDLSGESCEHVIPLVAGSRLGAAVEAANRLFVPDYTTGQVWIIDLGTGQVVAKPQVLGTAKPFQLLTRDGVVFFNDPDSEQAGVIQLGGTVTKVAKYDVQDPRKGVTAPADQPGLQGAPGQTQQPRQPNQGGPSQQPSPQQPPDQQQQQPQLPDQPIPPPGLPDPPVTGDPPTSAPPTSAPPAPPLPTLRITANPSAPIAGDPVTFNVTASGGEDLHGVSWSFQGGGRAEGRPVTHTFAAQGSFMVTVQATIPDGRPVTSSTTVAVGRAPTIKVTVSPNPQNGRVTGGGMNCPGVCSVDVDRRTGATLTAAPAAGFVFDSWLGAWNCGSNPTCELDMQVHTRDTTIQAEFKTPKPPTRLTVRAVGGGAVLTRIDAEAAFRTCRATCTYQVPDPDQAVDFRAEADPGRGFQRWTQGCDGCTTPMMSRNIFQDATVEATFGAGSSGFVWILPLVGLAMPLTTRKQKQRRRQMT